jgi:hypothetical protein
MQETLAHEWRRRMATRSTLVALLLSVPVFAAALIGFSGGIGGLPFGINALATGPEAESPGVSLQQTQPASSIAPVLAPAADAVAATAGGDGAGPAAGDAGAGTDPAPVSPVSPGSPGGGGGGGGGNGSGGSTPGAPAPPSAPQAPQAPAVAVPELPAAPEPVGSAVEDVTGTVEGTVNDVLNPGG